VTETQRNQLIQPVASDNDVPRKFSFAIIAALVAVHLVALLLRSEGCWDSPSALVFDGERPFAHTHVAHVSPILSPRIPDDPKKTFLLICTPTDNGNHVIYAIASFFYDTSFKVQERSSVDAARDGATIEYLSHHCSLP
jgi:hypothetical protein